MINVENLTEEQEIYFDWLDSNWEVIRGIFRSHKFDRNGGWNGMMDAIDWVDKNACKAPMCEDKISIIEYALEKWK